MIPASDSFGLDNSIRSDDRAGQWPNLTGNLSLVAGDQSLNHHLMSRHGLLPARHSEGRFFSDPD